MLASIHATTSAGSLTGGEIRGYLIDLAVVILGVTAAFALNSWWERRRHRQLEQKYYRNFEKDIDSDLEQLAGVIELNRAKRDKAARFVESLRSGSHTLDSSMEIIRDILTMLSFKPVRTTYSSLVNSGDFNSIGRFEFKADLVKLYDAYDEAAAKEGWLEDFVSRFAMPFIYGNLDLAANSIPDPELIHRAEFKNLVLGYYALLIQSVSGYEAVQTTGTGFMSRLKSRIGKGSR
jgi:hypothetical protein